MAIHAGEQDDMPFLVLDRNGDPMTDPVSGLIRQFDTRGEAEAYRKANKGLRVIEVPAGPDAIVLRT